VPYTDTCECCASTVEHCQSRVQFHFHGQTIYVDHMPAWVCACCREQYFDVPVYKRLKAIARQRERITETVCFPLAAYDMRLD
jgi:YgiT-type zinc finger domain-containing protein